MKSGDQANRPKRTDRRGSGGELFITLRNVLFRGLLDEEEDLEKRRRDGEDGARMKEKMELERGRGGRKGREEGGGGGGGDRGRKDVPGVEIRVRERARLL